MLVKLLFNTNTFSLWASQVANVCLMLTRAHVDKCPRWDGMGYDRIEEGFIDLEVGKLQCYSSINKKIS